MGNQRLKLVQHVVINHVALVFLDLFRLAVINAHQVVTEGRHHEELLHHAVHVADAAQVAQAHVLLLGVIA